MKQKAPEKLQTDAYKNNREKERREAIKRAENARRREEVKQLCSVQDLPEIEVISNLSSDEKLDVFFKKYVMEIDQEAFDTLFDYDCLSINLARSKKMKKLFASIQDNFFQVDLSKLSYEQKVSVLINAYNFYAVKTIIDFYDGGNLESIFDIEKKHGKKPFLDLLYSFAGEKISLDHLEKKILQPLMINQEEPDPRFHFAVICAAMGCPILLNEAFKANEIDTQLDFITKAAFKLDRVVKFVSPNKVEVFEIFEWYKDDFKKSSPDGTVLGYLKEFIEVDDFDVPYDYDWRINKYSRKEQ